MNGILLWELIAKHFLPLTLLETAGLFFHDRLLDPLGLSAIAYAEAARLLWPAKPANNPGLMQRRRTGSNALQGCPV
jgi:hypothetical protein